MLRTAGALTTGIEPMRHAPIFMSIAIALAACSAPEIERVEHLSFANQSTSPRPVARWDFKPDGAAWTDAALDALGAHGAPLVAMTPSDVGDYCPAYASSDASTRKAFWVGFLSALAKHESTWQADVSSPNGKWHGLLQISPATAAGYGCEATTAEALKTGSGNLSCAIRIMTATVTRDGVISEGKGGVAADWGPFSVPEKRADIQAWTRSQTYCGG